MGIEFTVVSLGTLSSNPFWNEPGGVRTPHATTTLVRDADRVILVDPSLPSPAIEARLLERTGLKPEAITYVFCTTLRPTHRRGLGAFSAARWTCAAAELDAYRETLDGLDAEAGTDDADIARAVAAERDLIDRFQAAPDKLTDAVHLFPLPGPSTGSAGLLLAGPRQTVIVAGDAAVTIDHVLAGRAWSGAANPAAAVQSLTDLLEIANLIVCGHDNYMPSPTRWMS